MKRSKKASFVLPEESENRGDSGNWAHHKHGRLYDGETCLEDADHHKDEDAQASPLAKRIRLSMSVDEDVLPQVVLFLGLVDLTMLLQCSTLWQRRVTVGCRMMHELVFPSVRLPHLMDISQVLVPFSKLRKLDLSALPSAHSLLAALSGQGTLHQTLERIRMPSAGLVRRPVLAAIAQCPRLRHVDLTGIRSVTDAILQSLASDVLESVVLRGCFRVTDEGLVALLRKSPALRELRLRGCLKLTESALVELGKLCPLLTVLEVSSGFARIDAGAVVGILKAVSIDRLALEDFDLVAKDMADLAAHSKKKLRQLQLRSCRTDGEGVKLFSKACPQCKVQLV